MTLPKIKIGQPKPFMRAVVVLLLMTMFAAGYAATLFVTVPAENHDSNNLFQGALLIAFGAAWGYYLGNSSGAALAHEQVSDLVGKAPPPTTPPVGEG
jgi:hypothetical protein